MIDAGTLDALAAGFSVLGRLHRQPPGPGELAALQELLDEWPLSGTAAADSGLACLRRSFEAGEDAESIRVDHDRLYGVSAKSLVPPYESVHLGIEGLVFDRQTLEVRNAYRALGLQAPKLNTEPDDHIGLEFDFVAQSLLSTLEASEAGADPQLPLAALRNFLADHLHVWAPAMLTSVAAQAQTEFMRGVALLSQGALESCTLALD